MNQAAINLLSDVDIVIFVVAGTIWHQEDEAVFQLLRKTKCPIILVINKIDLVAQKQQLLECIKTLNEKHKFTAIIPLSAQAGDNVKALEEMVQKLLPENPFFFPPEQITDRDHKFLVAEIIREKLIRFLGQELPYALAVIVEQMVPKENVMHLVATIYVERVGQKAIIIGKNGEMLKKVGILARREIENLLAQKVFLKLWVKIKSDWTEDKIFLQQLGL
jgi:GTPase